MTSAQNNVLPFLKKDWFSCNVPLYVFNFINAFNDVIDLIMTSSRRTIYTLFLQNTTLFAKHVLKN